MLISVSNLSAGYARPVFGPVSFVLARGEILGLVGPNGCGKSTLLSALLGGARVFFGEVRRAPGLTVTLPTQAQPDVGGVPLTGDELLALTGASAAGLPGWLAPRLGLRGRRLARRRWHVIHGPRRRRRPPGDAASEHQPGQPACPHPGGLGLILPVPVPPRYP